MQIAECRLQIEKEFQNRQSEFEIERPMLALYPHGTGLPAGLALPQTNDDSFPKVCLYHPSLNGYRLAVGRCYFFPIREGTWRSLQGLDETCYLGLGIRMISSLAVSITGLFGLRRWTSLFFRDLLRGAALVGGWKVSWLDPIQGIKLGELEEVPASFG
jgi:hypothetical protein